MISVQTLEDINLYITDGKGILTNRNGLDSIIHSAMQTFDGNFLIPNDIDRVINVYYHLATTQYFTDGNKRTACLSLKVNFEELGYGFEVKDTILADLTMKVATNKISEEECRKIIRKYIK